MHRHQGVLELEEGDRPGDDLLQRAAACSLLALVQGGALAGGELAEHEHPVVLGGVIVGRVLQIDRILQVQVEQSMPGERLDRVGKGLGLLGHLLVGRVQPYPAIGWRGHRVGRLGRPGGRHDDPAHGARRSRATSAPRRGRSR